MKLYCPRAWLKNMRKGDLVEFIDPEGFIPASQVPGMIIKGPYGHVSPVRTRYDGKVALSTETKFVDVLLNNQVLSKIPIENLRVVK